MWLLMSLSVAAGMVKTIPAVIGQMWYRLRRGYLSA